MNSKIDKNKQSQTFLFKKNKIGYFFFCFILLFTACSEEASMPKITPLPTKLTDQIQAVIEMPTGTNQVLAFNVHTKKIEPVSAEIKKSNIPFLPMLGNYGFIASSLKKPKADSSRNALEVLVISASLPIGTLLNIQPIGVLEIMEQDVLKSRIVAIPSDTTLQVMPIVDFKDLLIRYDVAKRMIEDWFLTYQGTSKTQLVGWQDEKKAIELIEQWSIK